MQLCVWLDLAESRRLCECRECEWASWKLLCRHIMLDWCEEWETKREKKPVTERNRGREGEGRDKRMEKKRGYKNERGMRKTGERGRMFYRCHLKERAGVEADCNELYPRQNTKTINKQIGCLGVVSVPSPPPTTARTSPHPARCVPLRLKQEIHLLQTHSFSLGHRVWIGLISFFSVALYQLLSPKENVLLSRLLFHEISVMFHSSMNLVSNVSS